MHASTCQPTSQEVWLLLALLLWSYGWVCGRSWPRQCRRRQTLRRGRCFLTSQAVWRVIFSGVFSCAVEAIVGLDVVDKHRRGWLRRRRCDKQSRVDSEKDIDEHCGGSAGVHWGQQGGNWHNIGKCCYKTVLSVHAEYFQNMKRQRGELKKCSRYEPKREKEDCLQDIASQNAWLLSNVFDADGNFLYYQKCIMSVLGMPQ